MTRPEVKRIFGQSVWPIFAWTLGKDRLPVIARNQFGQNDVHFDSAPSLRLCQTISTGPAKARAAKWQRHTRRGHHQRTPFRAGFLLSTLDKRFVALSVDQ